MTRKVGTSKVRMPIRRRAKPKKQDRTPADSASAQARKARSHTLNAAIDASLAAVWQEAEDLAQRFPEHGAKYYAQLLLQRGKKRQHKRKLTGWNAFCSKRVREMNAGKYLIRCCLSSP